MCEIPILRAAVAGRGIEAMIDERLDGLLAFANDHQAGRCQDLGQSPQNRPRIALIGEPLAVFYLVLSECLLPFAGLDPLDAVDFIQHSAAFIAVLIRRCTTERGVGGVLSPSKSYLAPFSRFSRPNSVCK